MKNIHVVNQKIYITSDEEIKEGDWYIFPLYKKGFSIKCYNSVEHFFKEPCISLANLKAKKIILTTDQDLIKDGVQAIDDEFLEWFVKNPNCEMVEVELVEQIPSGFNFGMNGNDEPPTELVYQIIIPSEEPHTCKYCGVKTTQSDDECYAKPKQETLEEAAKNYTIDFATMSAFKLGAKWQQERMYSEEDVHNLLDTLLEKNMCSHRGDELIKQFKKK